MNFSQVNSEISLLPNLISLGRIVLLVPIVLLYPEDQSTVVYWIVIGLLVLSYLSDYLDGWTARVLHQQSKLGLILDPVADKIWSFTMIFLLCRYRELPLWIALVIVLRDIYILAISFWLLRIKRQVLPSDEFGRIYMVILGLLIIGFTIRIPGIIWLSWLLVALAPINIYRYTCRISRQIEASSLSSVKTRHITVKE